MAATGEIEVIIRVRADQVDMLKQHVAFARQMASRAARGNESEAPSQLASAIDALCACFECLAVEKSEERLKRQLTPEGVRAYRDTAMREMGASLDREEALKDGLAWALGIIESGQYPAIDFSGKTGFFARYKRLINPDWGKKE